jgi:hypothetical protein
VNVAIARPNAVEAYLSLRAVEQSMAKAKKRDPKSTALARDGVLNPNPGAVRDVVFTGKPFFDAKDLVQVRYEMVRRHQIDGITISDAAAAFGGEAEASSTPTIRRLTPSCRLQLSPIARRQAPPSP